MRRFFLGLLLLGLSGAALGAVLTWPHRASEVAGNSPTLSEFQTGVRVQQLSALVAQNPGKANGETIAAKQLSHVMDEARYELDRTSGSGQADLFASSRSPPQPLSAGDNLPEMVPPQPAGLHMAAPAATEVAANAPVIDPPSLPAQSTALPPGDLSTETALAPGMEQPRTQTQYERATDVPQEMLMTDGHVERISIHYYKDTQSRTDAQQILAQLRSAGLNKVEMHTTARGISAPLVRYFSVQDAPAAVSLAKMLGSKTATWRADDCTAYRRKPEPGTLELWPASAAASSPAKGKSQPAKLNAAR
jgi:hypothetical protein